MSRADRGAVLLEVVVALAVFATVGVAFLGLVAQHANTVQESALRERELESAERLIALHSVLSRLDLDRRIGAREHGELLVTVGRPERELYRIAVRRAAADVEDLVTVVYRPEERHEP